MNRLTHIKSNPDTEAEYQAEVKKKGTERLAALEQIRGLWKDRQPDPIKEFEEMRNEWERDLP